MFIGANRRLSNSANLHKWIFDYTFFEEISIQCLVLRITMKLFTLKICKSIFFWLLEGQGPYFAKHAEYTEKFHKQMDPSVWAFENAELPAKLSVIKA